MHQPDSAGEDAQFEAIVKATLDSDIERWLTEEQTDLIASIIHKIRELVIDANRRGRSHD